MQDKASIEFHSNLLSLLQEQAKQDTEVLITLRFILDALDKLPPAGKREVDEIKEMIDNIASKMDFHCRDILAMLGRIKDEDKESHSEARSGLDKYVTIRDSNQHTTMVKIDSLIKGVVIGGLSLLGTLMAGVVGVIVVLLRDYSLLREILAKIANT